MGAAAPASIRLAVPWRSDGGYRDELWKFCREWWDRGCPDLTLAEGASPAGPFNRAAAIHAAADGEWDILVVLDADVLADPRQIYAAAERARATGRVTLGFDIYYAIAPNDVQQVLSGRKQPQDCRRWGTRRNHESSIVAIPRALWDDVGGFDTRFNGWGQEDVAFAQVARVLGGGLERVHGPVWHFWHPPSPERDRKGTTWIVNQGLGQRYRKAKTPADVRALLAERSLTVTERTATFQRIYTQNLWNGKNGTRSGPGSSPEATAELVHWLLPMLEDLGVSSVLDAGCGDSLWMPELPGYVGVDIVPQAIEMAHRKHPDREYRVADLCVDELPRRDAVFCRDALQHLSLLDGLTALQNFRRTGAKWLIASSHRSEVNSDQPTGGYYSSNLEAAPFWFERPAWEMFDGRWEGQDRFPSKIMGVWAL